MTKPSTMNELSALSLTDLQREIKAQTLLLEKMRSGVQLKKEKDTAQLKRERRQLARMKTEQTRKTRSALPKATPASTVSTSAVQASPSTKAAGNKKADKSVPSKK